MYSLLFIFLVANLWATSDSGNDLKTKRKSVSFTNENHAFNLQGMYRTIFFRGEGIMSSYIFDISMTRDSYSIIITWNELFLHENCVHSMVDAQAS